MKTELEALESIYWYIVATGAEDDYKKYYERIKSFIKDAKKYKKNKKVLEIIKNKNVNVRAFKKVLLMKQNDDVKLRVYNSQNHRYEDDLTQAEYELLKEVLK